MHITLIYDCKSLLFHPRTATLLATDSQQKYNKIMMVATSITRLRQDYTLNMGATTSHVRAGTSALWVLYENLPSTCKHGNACRTYCYLE